MQLVANKLLGEWSPRDLQPSQTKNLDHQLETFLAAKIIFLWNVTVDTSYDQQLYFRKSNLQQNIDCNFCSKLQKAIQVSKIIFKADWLGVIIVQLSFVKPKLEVYIFNRATLSSFSKTKFTKKEDLIKTNRYFYLLALLFGLPKNKKN